MAVDSNKKQLNCPLSDSVGLAEGHSQGKSGSSTPHNPESLASQSRVSSGSTRPRNLAFRGACLSVDSIKTVAETARYMKRNPTKKQLSCTILK